MKTKMGSEELAGLAALAVSLHASGDAGLRHELATRKTLTPRRVTAEDGSLLTTEATFQWLGTGGRRTALLGPDGVVYKAPHSTGGEWRPHPVTGEGPPLTDTELEHAVFDANEAEDWCPEWWPYPEVSVTAMRLYRTCTDETLDEVTRARATEWLDQRIGQVDLSPHDWGLTDEGQVVLLDGAGHEARRARSRAQHLGE